MESAHQFSFRLDCNNTAEVPSFTLRTALSAIPFVCDLCGVDVQWFQERSSQAFAKFQRIVSVNDFRLPFWLQELLQAPLCFLRSFWFARIRLDPLGGQVLHHDSISMICFEISQPSLRTLWSVVIKSPKFSARGTAPPLRLLHGPLVMFVLWQISQFRSLGKWV